VRPIVVANRAPLVLEPADPLLGRPERLVKGAGGLVTALSSLAAETDALWVAAARDEQDRSLAARGDPAQLRTADGTDYRVAFIQPSAEAYDLYYNVISNPLLWFIQHYLWDLAREPVVTHPPATPGGTATWRSTGCSPTASSRRRRRATALLSS